MRNILAFVPSLATLLCLSLGFAIPALSQETSSNPDGIIYDSEFQLLLEQHGERWTTEDREIEARLDALLQSHSKPPNIIHIMWDDMKYGAIGHPMLNNVVAQCFGNVFREELTETNPEWHSQF